MKLEINVFDRVKVIDVVKGNFMEVAEFVVKNIKKWLESGVDKPLTIFIKNPSSRAPPKETLSVMASDKVKVKTHFGKS